MTVCEQSPDVTVARADATPRDQQVGRKVRGLSRWSPRWLVIVLRAYVLAKFVQFLWNILSPIIMALVVTVVLDGPGQGSDPRPRGRP